MLCYGFVACVTGIPMPGDDEESAALFQAPMAPPGSCVASVLRPLYRHLLHLQSQRERERAGEGEGEGEEGNELSPQLQALCCSSGSGSGSGSGNNPSSTKKSSSRFFDGPPGEALHSLSCAISFSGAVYSP